MRYVWMAALLVVSLVSVLYVSSPARAAECQFTLGFKSLHDLIPDVIGDCVTYEHHNPTIGETRQETTGVAGQGGLLVWRKADNATAYTDGYWTWVLGPEGLQKRLNSERFAWERDRLTLDQLKNAEYRVATDRNQGTTVRLSDGSYSTRDPMVHVTLVQDYIAYSDLNGDGLEDAVVLVAHNYGGSGVFVSAVAMINRNGTPEAGEQVFLGDRVRPQHLTSEGPKVTVAMIAHGPTEPLCCPTQHVTKSFILRH